MILSHGFLKTKVFLA